MYDDRYRTLYHSPIHLCMMIGTMPIPILSIKVAKQMGVINLCLPPPQQLGTGALVVSAILDFFTFAVCPPYRYMSVHLVVIVVMCV